MEAKLSFGSYVPGKSFLHSLDAQVKIILTCAFSIGTLFVDTWLGLGIACVVVIALFAASKLPLTKALQGVAPLVFILLFTVLVHALSFTLEGLLAGLFIAVRIALIVVGCALLSFTTSDAELVRGLEWLLFPLRRLHVPVDDLVAVISLALRFIPTVADEAYAIRFSQMARGADFESGSLLVRAKAWVPVFIPLLVRLFRRAGEIAQAMDARCFAAGGSDHEVKGSMEATSWLLLVACLVALVLFCYFL